MPNPLLRSLAPLLALAAALSAARAANVPETPPPGQITFTARLREENADQANLGSSHALTLRSALGLTSAPQHGLQAMIEAENIVSLDDRDDYNAAGTNPGGAGRTVIADPTGTDLNQAWLAFSRSPLALKAGRQRLVLDNARFVGDSGWRQNMQTFDAAAATLQPAKDTVVTYACVWRVSRVFGNHTPQPDFRGHAHLFNASYGGWTPGKLTAYAYRLDFTNSAANSSTTWGASFAGATPVTKEIKATYRAEFATQRSAARNPVDYRAAYSLLEIGATLHTVSLGAGYEVLGTDAGLKGFATPLATLHAFNGWADVFLTTPARGLRDCYGSLAATLPGAFPLKVVYHDYTADAGRLPYGHEWDALISRKLGRQWTVLAKVARYHGAGPFAGINRFWLQTEFTL